MLLKGQDPKGWFVMRHPARPSRTIRGVVATLAAVGLLLPLLSGCVGVTQNVLTKPIVRDLFGTCYNGKCLNYATWGANIDAAINGQAVGYAYAILHNGTTTIATNAFGQARTAADPPATAMTSSQPFNIASVTKTLTAVAALKLLAAQNISVTSSISPYLPPSWPLGQGVSSITFAQLLTHTSGLQVLHYANNNDISYAGLKALVGQDIDAGYKAGCLQDYDQGLYVRCYQNANFALFRILIPYILGPANPYPPAGYAWVMSGDALDRALESATAADYLSYMNSVYSGGWGTSFPISCTPQGSSRMLSYLYPGGGSGWDWNDWALTCGAGGIQLSVDQMATFLSNLTLGAYLPLVPELDPGALHVMVSHMYGWDYQFSNTTHGICVAKNGDLGVTNSNNVFVPYVTTLIVYCPATGLAFAGLANSRLGSAQTSVHGPPGSWDDIVSNAYDASWQ
jgi:CubicO group peptidase (beta-lactamase class C family)